MPASLERAGKAVFQKELSLSRQCKSQLVPRAHAQVWITIYNYVFLTTLEHRGLRSMQRKIRDVDCVLEVSSPILPLFCLGIIL